MTLHHHKVDDEEEKRDGCFPVHVPAGWQIANGSADDIRVCGAHPWQSIGLVFADGHAYGTGICVPRIRGNAQLQHIDQGFVLSPFKEIPTKTEIRDNDLRIWLQMPCTGRAGGKGETG
jgi:hypothetical protein